MGKAFYGGAHNLENLQFALVVAQTQGDQTQTGLAGFQITDLGGNIEELAT